MQKRRLEPIKRIKLRHDATRQVQHLSKKTNIWRSPSFFQILCDMEIPKAFTVIRLQNAFVNAQVQSVWLRADMITGTPSLSSMATKQNKYNTI